MPRLITLADGRSVEVECVSCALTSGLISSTGGVIFESSNFHVHQDIAYPIKGLVILASKRHFYCMDELTDEERLEFISLIHKLRSEQRKRLGIDKVYYFYNEDTTHHFHTWLVPRYDWMYEFGRSVESVRPVLLHSRNTMNSDTNMKEVMSALEDLKNELND